MSDRTASNGPGLVTKTRRVIGVAFEMICAALGLSDRGDRSNCAKASSRNFASGSRRTLNACGTPLTL
jgi:hypothetical protein